MHFRQRVAKVQIAYDVSGNPVAELLTGSALNQARGAFYFCPANTFYFADPISTFARLFAMWKLDDGCIEYVPRCGTNDDRAFTWGVTEDPIYADTHGWASGTGGHIPTEAQVSSLPGATQFPTYIPQQCIKLPPSKWLYSAAAEIATEVKGTDIVSDVRSQYSGALYIAGNENSTSTPSTIAQRGSIYFEGTIDLHELSATVTQDPSLLSGALEQALTEKKMLATGVKSSSWKSGK